MWGILMVFWGRTEMCPEQTKGLAASCDDVHTTAHARISIPVTYVAFGVLTWTAPGSHLAGPWRKGCQVRRESERREPDDDFDGLLERFILKDRSWCVKRVWI